jgi:hypothetical protein
MTQQNEQEEQVSEEGRQNLKRIAELRQNDSLYIKLQPSEKRILEFDAEKIEPVETDFNGKKTTRFQYTVTDANEGSNPKERYLTVSKRTSEEIDAYLLEGKTSLRIQRFGAGKDTRYSISSA